MSAQARSIRRNHVVGPSMEDLKQVARTILWNCGARYSPNKIARLCLRYERQSARFEGWSFIDFIATEARLNVEQRAAALASPDVARVLQYADPTGETAVNNVMRERKKVHH